MTRAAIADFHVALGDCRGDLWAGRSVGSGGQDGQDLADLHLHLDGDVSVGVGEVERVVVVS